MRHLLGIEIVPALAWGSRRTHSGYGGCFAEELLLALVDRVDVAHVCILLVVCVCRQRRLLNSMLLILLRLSH